MTRRALQIETVWTLLRALTMNLIAKLGEERKYSHAGI
jgi:hypothetical protein